MSQAVVAIGTNLGNRMENINFAVRAFARLPGVKIVGTSSVYETEPVGYAEQGKFYNAALLLETEVSPFVLLGECLGIEAATGRTREFKNGPRVLDLDLILYENFKHESYELNVPHPRTLERAFVMAPLLDLYPSGRAPGLFFGPHLRDIGLDGVRKTDHQIIIPIYNK